MTRWLDPRDGFDHTSPESFESGVRIHAVVCSPPVVGVHWHGMGTNPHSIMSDYKIHLLRCPATRMTPLIQPSRRVYGLYDAQWSNGFKPSWIPPDKKSFRFCFLCEAISKKKTDLVMKPFVKKWPSKKCQLKKANLQRFHQAKYLLLGVRSLW